MLDIAEPFVVGAVVRAGAGAPELVVVLLAVKLTQHILRLAAQDEPVGPGEISSARPSPERS